MPGAHRMLPSVVTVVSLTILQVRISHGHGLVPFAVPVHSMRDSTTLVSQELGKSVLEQDSEGT